jgi:hypothetical protein
MFGLLSLFLAVVSYVPYVRSILVGSTKPHAFTWLVWGTVMAIAFSRNCPAGQEPAVGRRG